MGNIGLISLVLSRVLGLVASGETVPYLKKKKEILSISQKYVMSYFYFVHMDVFPHACVGTMCVLGSSGSQKKTSDPLELELQRVVSCHVGTKNRTQVLLEKHSLLLTAEPFSPSL